MSQARTHYNPPPNSNPGAAPPPPNYYNRYNRSMGWHGLADKLFDAGPWILAVLSWVIVLGCLGALEVMDIVVGKVSAAYMTNGQYDLLISAGTTGLAIALIGACFYGWRERWAWYILLPLAVVSFIPVSIDVLNDAMVVDILRFGHFINTSVEFAGNPVEALMHNLYRVMLGGMSALGEPIAAAAVVVFPIMKDLLKGVFR